MQATPQSQQVAKLIEKLPKPIHQLHIAVVLGGTSLEREISLKTGESICRALIDLGAQVTKVDPADDNFIHQITSESFDLAYIALHGQLGEDGIIQGFFETLGIPYTGCGVLTSAIGMDKACTKTVLESAGVRVIPGEVVTRHDLERTSADQLADQLIAAYGERLIIKPVNEGSSIGVVLSTDKASCVNALNTQLSTFNRVLVERCITGTEASIPVIGLHDPIVLPEMEIVLFTNNGFFDFESKYVDGSTYKLPSSFDERTVEEAKRFAAQTFTALGCKGAMRMDFFVDDAGDVWVIEVNTLPGMTDHSYVPISAESVGISFNDLVQCMISVALCKE